MKKISVFDQFINDFGGIETRTYTKTVTDEKFEKSYKDYVGGKSYCGGCYMNVTIIKEVLPYEKASVKGHTIKVMLSAPCIQYSNS